MQPSMSIRDQVAIARQHYQKKQYAEAESLCRHILQTVAQQGTSDPRQHDSTHRDDDIDVQMLLGMALQQQQKLRDAQRCYEAILQQNPDHAPASNNLALVFKAQGKFEQAVHCLERAIATNPDAPSAYTNLGNILRQQGKLSEAQAAYEQALDRAPQDSSIRLRVGNVLQAQGDKSGAMAHYKAILKTDPTFVDAYNDLGNLLQGNQQFEDAVRCYQAGLQHAPTLPTLYNNMGAALQELGRSNEAIAAYHTALRHRPTYTDTYYNLGNALRSIDRLDEAIAAYRKALALNPNASEVYNNLGLVLHDQGNLKEAIAAYRHALTLEPDYPDAHLNLGISLLMDGDLEDGFREYEWRWQVTGRDFRPRRPYPQPLWDGRDLPDQTLLIYAEQGLGDTLQFIRFVHGMGDRVHRLIIECQPPLVTLLSTLPAIDQVIPKGDPLPDFDTHAPLMSLPHILGTTLPTLPHHVPYLSPPPSSPLPPPSPTHPPTHLSIGITWAGNPTHKNDRHRSCPFQHFTRLLDLPGIQLYSLQKGEREADLQSWGDAIINLSPHLTNFSDTAGAIAHLDLIITVDTSVAHLAGALGKPVWILLGFAYDWRWLRDRTDSPWYPTVRLFHQPSPGDWDGLFDQVIQTLQTCMTEGQPFSPAPSRRVASTSETNYRALPPDDALAESLSTLQQHLQHQQWEAAIAHGQNILETTPHQPHVLEMMGKLAYQQRRYDRAIAHFEHLCAAHPSDPDIWVKLGNAYLHSGNPQAALECYRDSLAHDPDGTAVRHNLAVALRRLGQDAEAIAHYRFILDRDPQSPDTHFNLANALRDRGDLDDAVRHYQNTITLKPDYANAWNNLANALKDLNRVDEAIACYRKTLALAPNHASAHHNLGYALLLKGDLRQGFAEYEWRWRVKNFRALPAFPQPQWDGSDLQGKTILLHTEQGFGDTIQFIRYVPLVADRGGRVIVQCRPPLARLLSTVQGIEAIAPRDTPLPPFDTHAPLMSLPHILGTPLPTHVPYLSPPPSSLLSPPSPTHLSIGITWAGSPTHKNDSNRSCPFAHFWRLLRTPGTQFFSLQKGDRRHDIDLYCDDDWPLIDLSDRLHDFADTAGAIAQLDLIITVDTAVAHLAGALGKPVWILLPYAPDWRWMLDRDDTPWYPTARLFRQPTPGNWSAVFDRIHQSLQPLIPPSPRPLLSPSPAHLSDRTKASSPTRLLTPSPTPSPPHPPTSSLAIGIELSTSTGWGVFGTNLTLQLLKTKHWKPMLLIPLLEGTQFNPIHQTLLAPLLQAQPQINPALAEHPQGVLELPCPVLKALGNHFVTIPQLERIQGQQNIGLIFFEDTALTPQDIQAAQSYDLIIAGSSWNAEVLRSHGIPNVETVCQGIDPTLFHPAPRSGVLGDRFVIFSGGKLEYRKGQDIVIEAFRRFQQQHPDALLLTAWHNIWPQTIHSIGQSGYVQGVPQVEASGKLQITEWLRANGIPAGSVIDVGAIANPLVGQLVREADVALFPNRCEGGTNLAAMECLACGVPTVLSANTGHLDLIQDGMGYALHTQHPIDTTAGSSKSGWSESSIDEILEQLEWMYAHRAQARKKALADAQRMQDWTWEKQVKRLLGVLGDRQVA